MFVRASKLMFGVLAASLVAGAAETASAHPYHCAPPCGSYHHYYNYHYGYHYGYGPAVVVNPVPVVYAANLPPVDIRLANPNQVALNYTLDGGAVQSLPAGQAVALNQDAVIAFDRGGAQGWNRFTLTSGAYKFIPAGGAWSLVRDVGDSTVVTAASPIPAAANPLPPATP